MGYYEDKLDREQQRNFFWQREPRTRNFSWQQESDQRNFSWQAESKQKFGWVSEKGSFYDWGLSDSHAF